MIEAGKTPWDARQFSSSTKSIASTKAQDAFLPHVEAGTITLVGATTENPSFEFQQRAPPRMRASLNPLTQGDPGSD